MDPDLVELISIGISLIGFLIILPVAAIVMGIKSARNRRWVLATLLLVGVVLYLQRANVFGYVFISDDELSSLLCGFGMLSMCIGTFIYLFQGDKNRQTNS